MKLPRYVNKETSRHGKVIYYFRPPGQQRVRMNSEPGTVEFSREYGRLASPVDEVQANAASRIKSGSIGENTLGWLCRAYEMSPEFRALDPQSQRTRSQVIAHCLKERVDPKSTDTFRDAPLALITSKAIRVLRDRKTGLPGAANKRLQIFQAMYAWAIDAEIHDDVTYNPVRDVKKMKKANAGGFHAWTLDEIEIFEQKYPVGTTPRLALALLLYTGQRRSDIVVLGHKHVKNGWLSFRQHKNRVLNPNDMEIPIIPELQRIIDASVTGVASFIVTSRGKPFTSNGFGNKMREWCDDAGLYECASHGLRKAAAARLAELDCTDREIMAITGHRTVAEVDRYTKGVRRRKLAEGVLRKTNASTQ